MKKEELRKLSIEQIEEAFDNFKEEIENFQVETFNQNNHINTLKKRLVESDKTKQKLQDEIFGYVKTIEEYNEVINSLKKKIAKYEESEKAPVKYPFQSECDCCNCCEELQGDTENDFDIDALIIEQQIEIEKLNATIDVLLERIS